MGSTSHFVLLLICLVTIRNAFSFTIKSTSNKNLSATTSLQMAFSACELNAHPSALPGDPLLILVTNVDLGDKKLDFMKACSKAIEAATGKPEAYIAVSVSDNADVIFGGSDDPTALGNLYSIGAISMESNGAIQNAVSDLLEPYGVDATRIYITFFDMDRANVGWNRKTFAG
jgi:phenylpyruvate tautomerase